MQARLAPALAGPPIADRHGPGRRLGGGRTMEQRVYHGPIAPEDLAEALRDEWDRGETVAQVLEAEGGSIVQIGQRSGGWLSDEPRQALTLGVEALDDGVRVSMGQQQWYKAGGQIMVGGFI